MATQPNPSHNKTTVSMS